MTSVSLAHVSDTHLGASAYAALSRNGNNQREQDIVGSFFRAARQICGRKLPLVIHSGDVFHVPKPEIEVIIAGREAFRQLAAPVGDGWQPQVVVSDGNHDEQRRLGRPSVLSLLKGIPGVHVVNNGYEQITFDPETDRCHPDLADVVVHAIPHIDLKHLNFEEIVPVDGKVNILTTHGVAEGSELYRLNLTREYAIPLELMTRGWDYVALGHYHRQGPVQPGQFGTADPSKPSKIWYAGSTDTITFSDFSGSECDKRGWLEVDVELGEMPKVTQQSFTVRRYLRLPTLDVGDLDQETVEQRLLDNLAAATSKLDGSVVVQKIDGISRDLWSTVDTRKVRDMAGNALHYELKVSFKSVERSSDDDGASQVGFGDLPEVLEAVAAERVTDDTLRAEVLTFARDSLAKVIGDGMLDGDEPDEDNEPEHAPTPGAEAPDDPAAVTDSETLPPDGDEPAPPPDEPAEGDPDATANERVA